MEKESEKRAVLNALARRSRDARLEKRKARLEEALFQRGSRLRSWRILSGYTSKALGHAMGVHWNTITGWEDGAVIPRWALQKLLELGWPAEEMMVNIGALGPNG